MKQILKCSLLIVLINANTFGQQSIENTKSNGYGFALYMSGWAWAVEPSIPNLPDNEDGRIEFEIECDENGEIIGIQTIQRGLSPKAEQLLKEEIRKNFLVRTSVSKIPDRSKGRVLVIINSSIGVRSYSQEGKLEAKALYGRGASLNELEFKIQEKLQDNIFKICSPCHVNSVSILNGEQKNGIYNAEGEFTYGGSRTNVMKFKATLKELFGDLAVTQLLYSEKGDKWIKLFPAE